MKKISLIIIAGLLALVANSQIITPVEWVYRVKNISESEFELQAFAIIDKSWHLYGQYFEDGGPVRLKFNFVKNEMFSLTDSVIEKPNPIIERDEIFNIDVHYFIGKAMFSQKVKINKPTEIILLIEGQACNDKTGMCVMVSDTHVFLLK